MMLQNLIGKLVLLTPLGKTASYDVLNFSTLNLTISVVGGLYRLSISILFKTTVITKQLNVI